MNLASLCMELSPCFWNSSGTNLNQRTCLDVWTVLPLFIGCQNPGSQQLLLSWINTFVTFIYASLWLYPRACVYTLVTLDHIIIKLTSILNYFPSILVGWIIFLTQVFIKRCRAVYFLPELVFNSVVKFSEKVLLVRYR